MNHPRRYGEPALPPYKPQPELLYTAKLPKLDRHAAEALGFRTMTESEYAQAQNDEHMTARCAACGGPAPCGCDLA